MFQYFIIKIPTLAPNESKKVNKEVFSESEAVWQIKDVNALCSSFTLHTKLFLHDHREGPAAFFWLFFT